MANLLATAATHGGVISRAISNGKRFIGGRSISSTSSSHVILDKLSATKILQCAFAGKIQPPPRPERIDADADELWRSSAFLTSPRESQPNSSSGAGTAATAEMVRAAT